MLLSREEFVFFLLQLFCCLISLLNYWTSFPMKLFLGAEPQNREGLESSKLLWWYILVLFLCTVVEEAFHCNQSLKRCPKTQEELESWNILQWSMVALFHCSMVRKRLIRIIPWSGTQKIPRGIRECSTASMVHVSLISLYHGWWVFLFGKIPWRGAAKTARN